MEFCRKKKPSTRFNSNKRGTGKTLGDKVGLLYYIGLVKSRIYTQWIIPGSLRNQNKSVVKIKLLIKKSGNVASVEFLEESQNQLLNRSVMEAIQNSQPFPPFPKELQEDSLEIIVNFDTNNQEGI